MNSRFNEVEKLYSNIRCFDRTKWVNFLSNIYVRAKAKNARQIYRIFLTKVWPLKYIGRCFYKLKFSGKWFNYSNRHSIAAFCKNAVTLDVHQSQMLESLRSTGVAVGSKDEFFPNGEFAALQESVGKLYGEPRFADQIKNRKSIDGAKWYVIRAFGRTPPALSQDIADIVFSPGILNVVNSYLGLWSKLRFVDIWHNLSAGAEEIAVDSEYWHSDGDDIRVVTLFLYIDDVTDDQGPFQYLKETHRGGRYSHVSPSSPPVGSFPAEKDVFAFVPQENVITCTGVAGTIVICDTSGIHKGGRVCIGRRLLLTARYVSESGIDRIKYHIENDVTLSREALHALE